MWNEKIKDNIRLIANQWITAMAQPTLTCASIKITAKQYRQTYTCVQYMNVEKEHHWSLPATTTSLSHASIFIPINVQRRATKIIPCFTKIKLWKQIKKQSLPTISYRRIRGDTIETYKIIYGYCDTAAVPHLELASTIVNTRLQCNKNIRKKKILFCVRIADILNSLRHDVISAPSVFSFKNRLDKFSINKKYDTSSSYAKVTCAILACNSCSALQAIEK